jgi:hypothetical protein
MGIGVSVKLVVSCRAHGDNGKTRTKLYTTFERRIKLATVGLARFSFSGTAGSHLLARAIAALEHPIKAVKRDSPIAQCKGNETATEQTVCAQRL